MVDADTQAVETAESNLLTPSRLRSHRECHEKHRIEYVEGVRPIVQTDALRTGTLWHDCMETGLLAVMSLQQGDSRAYSMFEHAALTKIPFGADPYEAARLRCYVRCARLVMEQQHFFDHHRILAVEKPFVFPHLNPATLRHSPLWLRAGKMDAVLEHVATRRVRVCEHKTTDDNLDADSAYWQYLLLDVQISQYVLGVEAMMPGIVVDEIVYDVLKKTGLRPLRATPHESRRLTVTKYKQCPECKRKGAPPFPHNSLYGPCEVDPDGGPRRICTDPGGEPYSGTRLRDETPEEYEKRVWEEDVFPNLSGHYVIQIIHRTERQIEAHLRETWAQSQEMREERNNGFTYRNPDACHRYGTCAFFKVCTGQTTLDDPAHFVRLSNVHPELGDDFVARVR